MNARNVELKKEMAALKLENEAVFRENSRLRAESPLPEYLMLKLPAFVCLSNIDACGNDFSLKREYANPMLHRCLGYPQGEFEALGTDCYTKWMQAEDLHCLTGMAAAFKAQPAATYLTACRLRTKEGRCLTVLMAGCSLGQHVCGSTRQILSVGIPLDGELHHVELIEQWLKEMKQKKYAAITSQMSKRKREVIKLFVAGYAVQEVADKLCTCKDAVKKHRAFINKKFQTKDRKLLIIRAKEYGLD